MKFSIDEILKSTLILFSVIDILGSVPIIIDPSAKHITTIKGGWVILPAWSELERHGQVLVLRPIFKYLISEPVLNCLQLHIELL